MASGAAAGTAARPDAPTVSRAVETMVEVGSKRLNAEQRWAVASFLEGAGAELPFTLFGPPGTGKTVTLVECALQVLKRDPTARLLICAPQNYSADLLASALGQAGLHQRDMLRMADPRHPPVQMKEDVLHKFSTYDDKLRAFGLPDPALLARKRVVVTTCTTAGTLKCGAYKQFHHACKSVGGRDATEPAGFEFSHILVDEAGQASLPETLIPLALLQPVYGKVLLCGDPKQLGPIVRSAQAAIGGDGKGLAVSLLESFIEYNSACAPSLKMAGKVPATATLTQNYRSHSSLLKIPNALFYDQKLIAASDQSQLLPPSWRAIQKATNEHGQSSGRRAPADQHGTERFDGQLAENPDTQGTFAHLQRRSSSCHEESGRFIVEENPGSLPSTLFFGVKGNQMRDGEEPSYFNPIEAITLVELLTGLLQEHRTQLGKAGVSEADIGVIATYRKQVQKIRQLLRCRGLSRVRVGTVDDFQGQEERIIFISTVLTKPETLPPITAGSSAAQLHLGFWRNPRRFNVAVTRAKALLVVLGHPVVLVQDPNWRELLRFCAARNAFKGAGSDTMADLIRSSNFTSTNISGLTQYDDAHFGEGEGQDLAAAVSQIAEMALLGVGHAAQMFPDNLDEIYAAYGDETQWRVAI